MITKQVDCLIPAFRLDWIIRFLLSLAVPRQWTDIFNLHTHRIVNDDRQHGHADLFCDQDPLGQHQEDNRKTRTSQGEQQMTLSPTQIAARSLVELISQEENDEDDDNRYPYRPWPVARQAHGLTCTVRHAVPRQDMAQMVYPVKH